MCKPIRVSTKLLSAFVLLTVGTNVGGEPTTKPGEDSVNPYEQTRDGITVRVEKITVEQVFNAKGWLQKQDGPPPPDVYEPVPFQVVHLYVSVIVDEAKAGESPRTVHENSVISFKLAEKPPIVSPVSGYKWGAGSLAQFDHNSWQKQLPDIEVDPKAFGYHFYDAVNRDAKTEDLFPAKLNYQVKTADGEEIEFAFSELEF